MQLVFGRRLSLFLFHVWRKEPFGEGRTSVREAWEISGIGTKPPKREPYGLNLCRYGA